MPSIKNIALAGSTLLTLTLAVSQTNAAAPAASAASEIQTHKHTHPATTTQTDSSTWVMPKTKLKSAPNETLLYVNEMHCGHCAKKIAGKLYAVKGVVKVRTDIKAGLAIITPQKKKNLDPLAIWTAANKSGFPAMKLVGPTGTYVLNPKTKKAELEPKKTAKIKS